MKREVSAHTSNVEGGGYATLARTRPLNMVHDAKFDVRGCQRQIFRASDAKITIKDRTKKKK